MDIMENSFDSRHEAHEEPLAQKLRTGEISGRAFLDLLTQEDQKTVMHHDAFSNVRILESEEVSEYFLEQEDEHLKDSYHNLSSISYFHVAQICAISEHVDPINYFEKASIEAEAIEAESFHDW
jgi:hypothetical protein